jgi:histidine ammonia-lyase
VTVAGALVLGAGSLTIRDVVATSRSRERNVRFHDDVQHRLSVNADLARRRAQEHALYGRTTGVGANRHVVADDRDGHHGRRLLRSHCAGAGPVLDVEIGRAVLIIRAHQLAAARSGVSADVPAALVDAFGRGLSPQVRRFGGVGTGDITVLAELGLALLGERPWSDGSTQALLVDIDASSALPLMSSSAPTLAVAAFALDQARELSVALMVVGALSAWAVKANPEAWSVVASSARAHPGMASVGLLLRTVLADVSYKPPRLQDPFGWRSLVAVHGALHDVLDQVWATLEIDLNASTENPIYDDDRSWHHGGFHHAGLALGLDQLRLALVQVGGLSLARLTKINDPAFSGLRPFLADGPAGSSGTMVLEYTAASALATLRQHAAPATLGHVAISLGLEDHASFAWEAAMATSAALQALRIVVATELVAAVRTLRQQGVEFDAAPGGVLGKFLGMCAVLPGTSEDHVLVDDIAAAEGLLVGLGQLIEGLPRAD